MKVYLKLILDITQCIIYIVKWNNKCQRSNGYLHFYFFLDYNFYGMKIIIVFFDVYLIINYIIKKM